MKSICSGLSPRKCFIYLCITTALVVTLTYTFSELMSPSNRTRQTTKQHSYSASISALERARARQSNLTLASIIKGVDFSLEEGKNVSLREEAFPGEFDIPKETLRFYQLKIGKLAPRDRLREKMLKEVPDEAHRVVMKIIVSSIGRSKYLILPSEVQEAVYKYCLKKAGFDKRLPTVINIGAKKAGTTALGLFTRSHPQVASANGNEVHYFDWNYERGIEFYRSRMRYSGPGQEIFEKTPRYFITKDAPRRIRDDISPNVKLILSVRDPVERALSDYHHEEELYTRMQRESRRKGSPPRQTRGPDIAPTFEATVLRENGEINTGTEIIHVGLYVEHLKRWLQYFPMRQILVLDGDKLTKEPLQAMKTVEKFLGISSYFTENHFQFNRLHHVYCLALPSPMCKFSSPHTIPKPVISNDLRTKMYDFYRPYNIKLMDLLNQTFSWGKL